MNRVNKSPTGTETTKDQEVRDQHHSELWKSIESFQARHSQKRTPWERLADSITAKSGSMMFLAMNVGFFIVWIVLNHFILSKENAIDPFPFPALTTIVSLEAIFLAIVVLISQNREMKIQDLRQELNLHIDTIAEKEITKLMNLTTGLYHALNIPLPKDPEISEMSRPTDSESIERELEQQAEEAKPEKAG